MNTIKTLDGECHLSNAILDAADETSVLRQVMYNNLEDPKLTKLADNVYYYNGQTWCFTIIAMILSDHNHYDSYLDGLSRGDLRILHGVCQDLGLQKVIDAIKPVYDPTVNTVVNHALLKMGFKMGFKYIFTACGKLFPSLQEFVPTDEDLNKAIDEVYASPDLVAGIEKAYQNYQQYGSIIKHPLGPVLTKFGITLFTPIGMKLITTAMSGGFNKAPAPPAPTPFHHPNLYNPLNPIPLPMPVHNNPTSLNGFLKQPAVDLPTINTKPLDHDLDCIIDDLKLGADSELEEESDDEVSSVASNTSCNTNDTQPFQPSEQSDELPSKVDIVSSLQNVKEALSKYSHLLNGSNDSGEDDAEKDDASENAGAPSGLGSLLNTVLSGVQQTPTSDTEASDSDIFNTLNDTLSDTMKGLMGGAFGSQGLTGFANLADRMRELKQQEKEDDEEESDPESLDLNKKESETSDDKENDKKDDFVQVINHM